MQLIDSSKSWRQELTFSFALIAGLAIALPAIRCSNLFAGGDQNSGEVKQKAGADSDAPKVKKSEPQDGADDVDPGLKEVRVTFDRDMEKGGMSWTGDIPVDKKRKAKWIDSRTCVLPVTLKPETEYRIGINSPSFKNFKSAKGVPVEPIEFNFTTKQADTAKADKPKKNAVPQIVSLDPANDADDVDSGIKELKVTFDIPMGDGMSWTGSGPMFPKIPNGKKAKWSADGKTCTLPVSLEADHDYELGINSKSFKNFRSKNGVPVEPVVYRFHTADAAK